METGTRERQAVFVIADISGYTPFMAQHKKALAHSQMVISALLQTILEQCDSGLQVAKLEGDAAFLYALRDGGEKQLGRRLLAIVDRFWHKLAELTATSICNCDACTTIDRLRLKIVVHAGEALFYKIGAFEELSGFDVIVAHRLLKNSVEADQYILLTEEAYRAIEFGEAIHAQGSESYDGIDPIRTYVHFPAVERIQFGDGVLKPWASGGVAVEILRYEVRKEYAEVATCPTKGFHFHTGRPLAAMCGYPAAWIDELPAAAVESMAGTGNPFQVGPLRAGERVVDVGCGAGADSLIAARQVGPSGRVKGFDLTPQMVAKARGSAAEVGLTNVEFAEAEAEAIPVEDGWADVVISNGAINLCPDKGRVFRELFRVLKPGGRLQIGDIAVERAVPEKAKRKLDLWTG